MAPTVSINTVPVVIVKYNKGNFDSVIKCIYDVKTFDYPC